MKIASRISRIEASKTLQVKEKALQLKAKGIDVVDLTAGEPDFDTPSYISKAGIEAIQSGFTRYTANAGIPDLLKAIADKLRNDNGLDYNPNQIIVSNGAKQSILNALMAIVEAGDEVLIIAPYWVSYPEQVKIAGAQPVIIDTGNTGFKLTPEILESHITPRTQAIILNSPSNPTGVVYTRDELNALADVLQKHSIWIISDEIYEKIIYDGLTHTSIATFGDLIGKSIVVNGFSKSFAMTGWRLGYAAAPLEVTRAMGKIQGHYTSNASSISQKAALAALTGPQNDLETMREQFELRRNYIRDQLRKRDYFSFVNPGGAFYFLIKVSEAYGCEFNGQKINDSVSISSYLAEEKHLVAVPGIAFGADEYIRISFATSREQLERGMKGLIDGMDHLMELKK